MKLILNKTPVVPIGLKDLKLLNWLESQYTSEIKSTLIYMLIA